VVLVKYGKYIKFILDITNKFTKPGYYL